RKPRACQHLHDRQAPGLIQAGRVGSCLDDQWSEVCRHQINDFEKLSLAACIQSRTAIREVEVVKNHASDFSINDFHLKILKKCMAEWRCPELRRITEALMKTLRAILARGSANALASGDNARLRRSLHDWRRAARHQLCGCLPCILGSDGCSRQTS